MKVELRDAFVWTCDECGRDNFIHAQIIDTEGLSESELQTHGIIEDDESIDEFEYFVRYPDSVKCPHCNAVYEVAHEEDNLLDDYM